MGAKNGSGRLLLLLLACGVTSEVWSGSRDRMREIPLEVLRYDAEPPVEAAIAHTGALGDAKILGPPRLHGYILRLQLEPGERILSAKGIVRDGFAHQGRSGKARKAARLLGALGYQLVLRHAPGDLHSSLGPIAGLVLPGRPESELPAVARVLVLRGESFHQHAGYAVAVVMLEANDLTRVELTRILTRRNDRRRKQRARAPAVLVRGGELVSRDELLQLLAGQQGGERHPKPSGRMARRDDPSSSDWGAATRPTRTHEVDGHGPPDR
jgi:hypothetical protein